MEASDHNAGIEIDENVSSGSWVVEVEKMISDTNRSTETARWSKRSIYRVPAWIKNLHPGSDAYRPQLVSLGPFHHGCPDLLRMEAHKRRAVAHLVRRSGKLLKEFTATVGEVAEQLRDAYEDDALGPEWRNRERFVELMVTDGCFLLEAMRMGAAQGNLPEEDYAASDPVFSQHGYLHSWDTLRRDMLVMENQLPLLLLHTLVALLRGTSPNAKEMNNMVLDALWPGHPDMITLNHDLGLHVLDIYHKSFCGYGHQEGRRGSEEQHDMPSAVELHEAGVHFKAVHNANLGDIRFERGVLSVPVIWFYDSIECEFLNLMAFERLHPKARNYVMEYVFFMDNLVDSAADVALLCSNGVIVNLLGSNEEVATLFNKILSKEAVMSLSSKLHDVHGQVSAHCRKPWNKWRANLIHTYFSNPWVFISLLAATILLVATLIQTIYTVVPFKRKDP